MSALRVTELKAVHLRELIRLKGGRSYLQDVTAEQAVILERLPYTYSVFAGDEIILCGGVTVYWPGRGEAWAVVNPQSKRYFVELNSVVKRFFELCPVRRIEASVEFGFENGHRWMRALGFKLDAARLEAFLPDGKDAALYSRVRKEVA